MLFPRNPAKGGTSGPQARFGAKKDLKSEGGQGTSYPQAAQKAEQKNENNLLPQGTQSQRPTSHPGRPGGLLKGNSCYSFFVRKWPFHAYNSLKSIRVLEFREALFEKGRRGGISGGPFHTTKFLQEWREG
jgi:hypothetical protein